MWDEPSGTVQHGAVAWRSRLLGWRGPYAMDALGWHDRARRHFTYWAGRQNMGPIPPSLPPPDASANLARSEAALHSNGDLSNSHYDMNLVYIDALMRHLEWTGDLAFARQVWPVIERHLAWERRLFRREFGPDRLPLYEAYAAIWASDDLQYHGGGVTHASAYNYFHNRMAARLARLLGHDAAPYEARGRGDCPRDARAPVAGQSRRLRRVQGSPGPAARASQRGAVDLLPHDGRRAAHAVRGLADDARDRDADAASPGPRRWRPADQPYAVLSTTDWMPYTWSVNNVVMGENVHTALGFWQAGRADEAFRLMKSALLSSMFMGIAPATSGR